MNNKKAKSKKKKRKRFLTFIFVDHALRLLVIYTKKNEIERDTF